MALDRKTLNKIQLPKNSSPSGANLAGVNVGARTQLLNNSELVKNVDNEATRFGKSAQAKLKENSSYDILGKKIDSSNNILRFQRKENFATPNKPKVDSVTQKLHDLDMKRTGGVLYDNVNQGLINPRNAIPVGQQLKPQDTSKQDSVLAAVRNRQAEVQTTREQKQAVLDGKDVIVPVGATLPNQNQTSQVLETGFQEDNAVAVGDKTLDNVVVSSAETKVITTELIKNSLKLCTPFAGSKKVFLDSLGNFLLLPAQTLVTFYVQVDEAKDKEVYDFLKNNRDVLNLKKTYFFKLTNPSELLLPQQVFLNFAIPDNSFGFVNGGGKSLFYRFSINTGVHGKIAKELRFYNNSPLSVGTKEAFGYTLFPRFKVYFKKDPKIKDKYYYSEQDYLAAYPEQIGQIEAAGSKAVAYEGELDETDSLAETRSGSKSEISNLVEQVNSSELNQSKGKLELITLEGLTKQTGAEAVGQKDISIEIIGDHKGQQTGGQHEFKAHSSPIVAGSVVAAGVGALAVGSGKLGVNAFAGAKSDVSAIGGFVQSGAAAVGSSGQGIRGVTGDSIAAYQSGGFQQQGSFGTTRNIGTSNFGDDFGGQSIRGITSIAGLRSGQTFLAGDNSDSVLFFTQPGQEQEIFANFRSPLAGVGGFTLVGLDQNGGLSDIQSPLAKSGIRNALQNSTTRNSSNNSSLRANSTGGRIGGSSFGKTGGVAGGFGGGKIPPGGRKITAAGFPDDDNNPEDDDEDLEIENLEGNKFIDGEFVDEDEQESQLALPDGDEIEADIIDPDIVNKQRLAKLTQRTPGKMGSVGVLGGKNFNPQSVRSLNQQRLPNQRVGRARQEANKANPINKIKDKIDAGVSDLRKKAYKELRKKVSKFVARFIIVNIVPWLLAAIFLGMVVIGGAFLLYCRPQGIFKSYRDYTAEPLVAGVLALSDPLNIAGNAATVAQTAGNILNPLNLPKVLGGESLELIPPTIVRKAIEALPGCSDTSNLCAQSGVGNAVENIGNSFGTYDCKSQKLSVGGTGARPPAAISDDASVSKAIFYYLTFINAGETEGASGPEATSQACVSDINPSGECWGMYQLPKSEVLGGAKNLDACKLYVEVFKGDLQGCRVNYLKDPALQAKVQMARLYKRQGSSIKTMSNYYGTNVVEYAKSIGLDYKSGQLPIEHLKEAQKAIDAKDFEKAKKIFRLVDYYDQAFGDRNQCSGDLCRYVKREKPVIDYAFSNDLYEKVKTGCSGNGASATPVKPSLISYSPSKTAYLNTRQQELTNKYWSEAFGFPVLAKIGEQIKNPVLTGLEVLDQRILAFNKVMEGKVSVEAFTTTGPVLDLEKDNIKSAELKSAIESGKLPIGLSSKDKFLADVQGGLDPLVVKLLLDYAIPNNAMVTALSTKTHRYKVGDVESGAISDHSYGRAVDFNLQNADDAKKLVKLVKDAEAGGIKFGSFGAGSGPAGLMKAAGFDKEVYDDGPGHLHVELSGGDSKITVGSTTSSDSCECPENNSKNDISVSISSSSSVVLSSSKTSSFDIFKMFGGVSVSAANTTADLRTKLAKLVEEDKIFKIRGREGKEGEIKNIKEIYDDNLIKYYNDLWEAGLSPVLGPQNYRGGTPGAGAGHKYATAVDIWGFALRSEVESGGPLKAFDGPTPMHGAGATETENNPSKEGNKSDPRIVRMADLLVLEKGSDLYKKTIERFNKADSIAANSGVAAFAITHDVHLQAINPKRGTVKGHKDPSVYKGGGNFYNGTNGHHSHYHVQFNPSSNGAYKSNSGGDGSLSGGECKPPCPTPTPATPDKPTEPPVNGPVNQDPDEAVSFLNIFDTIKAVAASAPTSFSGLSAEHKKLLAEVAAAIKMGPVDEAGGDKPEMLTAFEKLKADAAGKGFSLVKKSSYRSYDTQMETFFQNGQSDKIQKFYAEGMSATERESVKQGYIKRSESSHPPGFSEHHSGLGIDIVASNKPASDNLSRETYPVDLANYLAENAPKFGFTLSFGKDSGGANGGAKYEPWHFYFGTRPGASATGAATKDCVNTVGANANAVSSKTIEEIVKKYGGHSAVAQRVDNGKVEHYNGDQAPDNVASTIKSVVTVVVIEEQLKKLAASGVNENTLIYLPSELKGAETEQQGNSLGSKISIKDAVTYMLSNSSNATTNALVYYFGGGDQTTFQDIKTPKEKFTSLMKEYGFSTMEFNRYLNLNGGNGTSAEKADPNQPRNKGTALDITKAMYKVFQDPTKYKLAANALENSEDQYNIKSVAQSLGVKNIANKWGGVEGTNPLISKPGTSNIAVFEVDGKKYVVGAYINGNFTLEKNRKNLRDINKEIVQLIKDKKILN
jgi:D-alanyl-D-alanine carboxypeptidase/Beta-lactamase enzyme family